MIPVELVKAEGDAMIDTLTSDCNKILKKGEWLIDWTKSPSRKHLRTKVTPDFHLRNSKNGGNLGSESK